MIGLRCNRRLGRILNDGRLRAAPLLRQYLVHCRLYRQRRDWDSSFEIVRQHGLDDELASLVFDSVDEILFSGRLSTLRDWVRFARTRDRRPHPVFAVVEIELEMRHGRHATALTKARSLLETLGPAGDVAYRLCMVAARAAHAGGREEEALDYYRQARKSAQSPSKEREARWGELMCTSTLERPEAQAPARRTRRICHGLGRERLRFESPIGNSVSGSDSVSSVISRIAVESPNSSIRSTIHSFDARS